MQKVLRHEEKVSQERIPVQKRKEIFESIAGKTGVLTQKILDEQVSIAWPEKIVSERHRRDDSVELTLRLSKESYEKMQKVKELYSHIEPDGDWVKIIERMADDVIKKRDPLAKKTTTRRFAKPQVAEFHTKPEGFVPEAQCLPSANAGVMATNNPYRP